ncbi:hypothetical protein EWI73_02400 [Salmonella bongori]|uniref:Uncharacterized protein n=1 Tax=Salmonella bongori TaxID=54736 RepID=A0A8F8FLB6_SALBN|nr:hypothetical protein [Salmonella bongori]QXY82899.1 hypothetical protein EWI73_02400 [Salmonella bongori]
MRVDCGSWFRRLTVYYFCACIILFSYPRRTEALLPLAIPLVAAAVPAGTTSLSAISGVTLSYIAYTLGITAVATTAVGVALEYNGRTPSSTGANLRQDGIPVAASTMISMGVTKPSDWDMPYNGGRLVNVTSSSQLASVAPGLVNSPSLYSPPSLLNPVPVYIPPRPVVSYPSAPSGVKFTSYPGGVYNVSSNMVSDDVNPDNLNYISASDVNELASFILANNKNKTDYAFERIRDGYSALYYGGRVNDHGVYRDGVACGDLLPPLDYPKITNTVTSSSQTGRYMINGSVKTLPALSHIQIYVPAMSFTCFLPQSVGGLKSISNSVGSTVIADVTVSPNPSFIDISGTSQDTGNSQLLPPLGQVDDIQEDFKYRSLTPAQIASFINIAWQQASSREGYKGIPYSSSIAATPQLIKDIMDVRGMSLSLASLFEPVGQAGYWDIPVYNITLNQYVSINNIEADPVIDFGPNPGVTPPELASAAGFEKPLSPLLNIMPFMREIKLPYKASFCPTFSYDIPLINISGQFDAHCRILSPLTSLISQIFVITWTLLALFIILRRKG